MASTGKLNFQLDALASTNDKIAVTGILTIGVDKLGFNDFVFTNLGGLQVTLGTPYKLITSGGINPGDTLDPANLEGALPGGFIGALQITGNDIELVVTPTRRPPFPISPTKRCLLASTRACWTSPSPTSLPIP